MYYVYVIVNENQKIYIGRTNDLRRRINEHNEGKNLSTKGHYWKLVYYEAYKSKIDAINRESELKHHGQAKRWLKSRIVMSLKIV